MKSLYKLVVILVSLSLIGCEEDFLSFQDNTPPSVPTNIITETGDDLVIIDWSPVLTSDLAGYAVYYSDNYDGQYNLLGTTSETSFFDYGAANGITNYYAVASYDFNGNESDLSYDVAYDTPRPEGFDQSVYDYKNFPNIAGYDFSKYKIDTYNSENSDFFFENDEGTFYLNVWNDTDIQSMGRTNDIYDISYAPVEGWVELLPNDNVKYVRAIRGNTYVIWTYDNHFAKIRILDIYEDHIVFDWAYQTAPGNVELKTNRGMGDREIRNDVIVNRDG
jgi:hypothetical protein